MQHSSKAAFFQKLKFQNWMTLIDIMRTRVIGNLMFEFTCNTKGFLRVIKDERGYLKTY